MSRFAFRRRVGWSAAFIAAYALVLNVILSGILIAEISPAAAAIDHELCLGSYGGISAQTDADKKSGKTTIHCPLCVGHHAVSGLPPPEPTLIARVPLAASVVYTIQQRLIVYAKSFDHLSRGPPALI